MYSEFDEYLASLVSVIKKETILAQCAMHTTTVQHTV